MVGSGERGEGFFVERAGGVVGAGGKIFGLLNFCCTRRPVLFGKIFSGSHPLPPPVVTVSAGEGLAATGGGEYFINLISKGLRPFGTPKGI